MIDVTVTRKIAADINKVWSILENFGDLSWIPGADNVEVSGQGVGMTRHIIMPGIPPINETLESLDAKNKTLSYSIPKNEIIPFDNYVADVSLTVIGGNADGNADKNATHVNWHCSFDAGDMPEADARAAIEGNYGMILDGLEAVSCA